MVQDREGEFRLPLRWAGSKKRIIGTLASTWRSTDRRYIEAFAGSASLFFRLRPKISIINDSNRDLISAYQVLADSPSELHAALLDIPVSEEVYYRLRSFEPEDKFSAAVRFFYLNRYCFNGIYRTNRLGRFNVPFGRRTGSFPSLDNWLAASDLLRNAKLKSCDFEQLLSGQVRKGDFVYMDPPYAVSNRRVFAQYSANEFGISDLDRLRRVMAEIDSVGATFVVSYAQSPETAVLASGWFVKRKYAQRNVAGFSEHRRKAVEVIISNDANRLISL